MSGAPLLREATPRDRERIVALTLAAYAVYGSIMSPDSWSMLDAAVRRSLGDDAGVTRLVVELDGRIVGSAALYEPGVQAYGDLASGAPWPEVRLVAVDPEARGRGIARMLVDECARRARSAGAATLGLHTSRSMAAAIRLYARMGFVRDPERDFQPPGDELVEGYRLDLAASASNTEQEH